MLQGLSAKIFFFSESQVSGDRPPIGFEFLADMPLDVRFINHLNASETLVHFANADMLVNLGSSFSLLTPLLSSRPVILATSAKEGADIDFYETSETIKLDDDGTLLNRSLDEVRSIIIDGKQPLYSMVNMRRRYST